MATLSKAAAHTFARKIQQCLNMSKLPSSHLATESEVVWHDELEAYVFVTAIIPIDESDNRIFTSYAKLADDSTVMEIAGQVHTNFSKAIDQYDYDETGDNPARSYQ